MFATHNARKIDIGALGELSAIFIKEPAFLQSKIERAEFKTYVLEAEKHFKLVKESDRKKCVFMISKSKGQFLQIPQASYWKEELGNVWVSDESEKPSVSHIIAKSETDHVESVYKVFVDKGHPLTVQAVRSSIGGGIKVNDVIRAVNQLLGANLICTVHDSKSNFDQYMVK